MKAYYIVSELISHNKTNKKESTKNKIKKYAIGSIFPAATGAVAAGQSQFPIENKEILETEEMIKKQWHITPNHWQRFKDSSEWSRYRRKINIERTKHISIKVFKGIVAALLMYAFTVFMKRMKKKHDDVINAKKLHKKLKSN